jgi:hypothetical protein
VRPDGRRGFGGPLFALVLLTCLLSAAGCGTIASAVNSESSTASSQTPSAPALQSSITQRVTVTSRLVDRSASTTATTPKSGPANAQPVEPGTPHAWALAASAVLTHFNGDRDDLLAGQPATPGYVRMLEQSLNEWWGIGNREDLLAMLQWIDEGGHRQDWEELEVYLDSLDEDELAALTVQLESDPQAKHQVDMIREYARKLGAKSLVGWDYARFISLCRWGYACGFLTEEEAWDYIMPVAAMLQKTFASWAELGENYLIGREFWSYQQTQVSGAAIREVYESLLASPSGPWQQNAWDMDLGVVPSESIS